MEGREEKRCGRLTLQLGLDFLKTLTKQKGKPTACLRLSRDPGARTSSLPGLRRQSSPEIPTWRLWGFTQPYPVPLLPRRTGNHKSLILPAWQPLQAGCHGNLLAPPSTSSPPPLAMASGCQRNRSGSSQRISSRGT